jgi:4-hydroxy-tetrahydrodipicolinate reductase
MGHRLAIVGAGGRMGRALIANLAEFPSLTLAAAVDQAGSDFVGADSGQLAGLGPNKIAVRADRAAALRAADVVVDFSAAQSSAELLAECVAARVACVIGTTGQPAGFDAVVDSAARSIAVLQTANTSVGVSLLIELVQQAARSLPGFDIEIVEAHHRQKQDAPSGTALALGRAAARGRDQSFDAVRGKARDGVAPRRRVEIGFAVVRGGDIVGDHDVVFAGAGERLVLRHQATDRAIFARGALRAAAWLAGQPAGRFGMRDVLGL